jgi:xylulokinase
VVARSGQVLAEGSIPIKLFHVGDGGVEQDIEEIWAATIAAIRKALWGISAKQIRALGVSSQGGALQILSERGKPIGRVISWLDQRGKPYAEKLTAKFGRDWFATRVGHRGAGLAIGQLLRLRADPKQRLTHQHPIGLVGDLIVGRLCGRAAHDGTSAALTLLYNPALRTYDRELLRQIGIEQQQLPDLLSPRTASGALTSATAKRTGLPVGIPVSPAIHDQYAAALGTGATNPGTTMLGAGTSWVVLAISKNRTKPATQNAIVCHHLEQGEGQIVSLVNGGSALTWALELMGMADLSHGEIERLLQSAPAGCGGVSFWPFMARPGAEGVAPTVKGRLSGLQLSHQPAHIARAIVEGLAFELKRHLLLLQRAGVPVDRLVMGGATAESPGTTQIIADVTNLPLSCFGAGAGSVLGAAIIARGLVEPQKSLLQLSREMLPIARTVKPGAHATFYTERFKEYARELKKLS